MTPSQWAMERARAVLQGQCLEWEDMVECAVKDVALALDAAVAEEREACAQHLINKEMDHAEVYAEAIRTRRALPRGQAE